MTRPVLSWQFAIVWERLRNVWMIIISMSPFYLSFLTLNLVVLVRMMIAVLDWGTCWVTSQLGPQLMSEEPYFISTGSMKIDLIAGVENNVELFQLFALERVAGSPTCTKNIQ